MLSSYLINNDLLAPTQTYVSTYMIMEISFCSHLRYVTTYLIRSHSISRALSRHFGHLQNPLKFDNSYTKHYVVTRPNNMDLVHEYSASPGST